MENLGALLGQVVGVLVVLLFIGATGERATEVLKPLTKKLGNIPGLQRVKLPGVKSGWVISGILAAVLAFYFEVDIVSEVPVLEGQLPDLLNQFVSMFLIWVSQNYWHNEVANKPTA